MPAVTPVPAAQPPPQLPDNGVQKAGTDAETKAQMAYGASQTILTSPAGLTTPATTTKKTLLGG